MAVEYHFSGTGATSNRIWLGQEGQPEYELIVDAQGFIQTSGASGINSFYKKPQNVVTVSADGGDFTSIKEAVESISDAGLDNTYAVQVGPGYYSEGPITVTSGISVVGLDQTSVFVEPSGNHDVFTLRNSSALSFLNIGAAPAGFSAIHVEDPDIVVNSLEYVLIHKISMSDCDMGVTINNNISGTTLYVYGEITDTTSENTTSYGYGVFSSNGALVDCNFENAYVYGGDTNPPVGLIASGVGTRLRLNSVGFDGSDSTGTGLDIIDGVSVSINGITVEDWDIGINNGTFGNGSVIDIVAGEFENNGSYDIQILNTTTSGHLLGDVSYIKTQISSLNTFYVTKENRNIITIGAKGANFTSISDALAFISDESALNQYTIDVGPGIFVEPTIYPRQYISIGGQGDSTFIYPQSSGQTIFNISGNANIKDVVIAGATQSGTSAVVFDSTKTGGVAVFKGVTFGNNWQHLTSNATGFNSSITILDNVSCGNFQQFSRGFEVTNAGLGNDIQVINSASINFSAPYPEYIYKVSGSGASFRIGSSAIEPLTALASGVSTGLWLEDGASADVSALSIKKMSTAVSLKNVGSAPSIVSVGLAMENNIQDLWAEHPTAKISIIGLGDLNKSYIDPTNTNVSLLSNNPDTPGTTIVGDLFAGNDVAHVVEITDLLYGTTSMGLFTGGQLVATSGLFVNVSGGSAYVQADPTPADKLKRFDFSEEEILLPADSNSYIFIDNTGVLTSATSRPTINLNADIGRVVTNSSGISFIDPYRFNSIHGTNYHDRILNNTFGSRYVSGSLPTESSGNAFRLDMPSGRYYYGVEEFNPVGGYEPTFLAYYKSGSSWVSERTNTVNSTQYNVLASGLVNLSAEYFTKHTLYTVGDEGYEDYLLVYGSAQYSGLTNVEEAVGPTAPDFFGGSMSKLSDIIVNQASGNIIEFQDKRPIPVSLSNIQIVGNLGGGGGVTVHGDLTGLGADDHTQYLLTNGSRSMSGDLNMGAQNVTNVGTVQGVVVSGHSTRHLPNGADAITTAAPTTNLATNSSNSEGVQNSLARSDHAHAFDLGTPTTVGTANDAGTATTFVRSDHVHAHGVQTNTTLHALATSGLDGFMSSAKFNEVETNTSNIVIVSGITVTNANNIAQNTTDISTVSGIAVQNTSDIANVSGVAFTAIQSGVSLGTGSDIFSAKNGTNLEFNSVEGKGNVAIFLEGNNVVVSGTGDGNGDIIGPSSATNNAVVVYDGTTGKLVKDSAVIINPSGLINANTVSGTNVNTDVLTIDNLSGVLFGTAGLVSGSATTTQLPEGSNLYYTDSRVNANTIVSGHSITIAQNTADIITVSGLTVTNSNNISQNTTDIANVSGVAFTAIQSGVSLGGQIDIFSAKNGTDLEFNTIQGAGIVSITTAGNIVTISGTGDGNGDVVGPASATDNALAVYDGTTGKLIKNSSASISDITNNASNIVIVSGIAVQNSADIVTVSGLTVTNANNITTNSGYITTVSGVASQNIIDIATNSGYIATVSGIAATAIQSGVNVGGGLDIFSTKNGTNLEFNTVSGVGAVSVINTAGLITISGTDTGEANTASNLGNGIGLAATKAGVDLPFYSVSGVGNVTATLENNVVMISGTGDGAGDVVGPASSTDNAIAVYDGTTGKLIQNSAVTISGNAIYASEISGVNARGFVFAYDTTTQGVALANTFQDITFDTNAEIDGWTHTPSGTDFVCGVAGTFQLNYSATTNRNGNPSPTIEFRNRKNGTEIAGSQTSINIVSTNVHQIIGTSAIFTSAINDIITLQMAASNTNGEIDPIGANATIAPSVRMTINKL